MHPAPGTTPAFDVARRYVRLRELRADGYVRFDFAIGDPELAVELMLPLADYQVFCRETGACCLSDEQASAAERARSKWRYGLPGLEEQS